MNETPGVGHNRPEINLYDVLAPEALGLWLEDRFAPHMARTAELMDGYKRFLLATTAGIDGEDMAGKAGDFARQLRAEITNTDATRVAIKAPVLAATRQIDGHAKGLTDRLLEAKVAVEARLAGYLATKEAAARRAAEDAAARAAEDAQRLMDAAAATGDRGLTDDAVAALEAQQAAEAQAAASTAELSRTRGAGSVAGLRDHWEYEVEDAALVPAAYTMVNDRVVRAAIASGVRNIPGLRIFNAPRVAVR